MSNIPFTRTVALADQPDRYGLISRLFHWVLAALILWQLTGMVLKLLLGRQPVVGFFVGMHQTVGAVIFVLVVLRVLWAVANRGRRPGQGEGVMGWAAKAGHGALYLVMLAVPSIALLRGWGGTRPFAPLGLSLHDGRSSPIAWTSELGHLHGPLGWALLVLIGGHVAMALLHDLILRDRRLRRMI